MTLEIEKNVPLPATRSKAETADTAKKMEINDSVLCDTPRKAKSLAQALRALGCKQTSEKQADGKIRVWRTS